MSNTPDQRVVCSRCNGWGLIGDGHNTLGAKCPDCGGSGYKKRDTPDQRIDELVAGMLQHYKFRWNVNIGIDDSSLPDLDTHEFKQQLKSLVETMAKDIVDAGPTNGTAMEVRAEQRQRIPQVINKYFDGGKE